MGNNQSRGRAYQDNETYTRNAKARDENISQEERIARLEEQLAASNFQRNGKGRISKRYLNEKIGELSQKLEKEKAARKRGDARNKKDQDDLGREIGEAMERLGERMVQAFERGSDIPLGQRIQQLPEYLGATGIGRTKNQGYCLIISAERESGGAAESGASRVVDSAKDAELLKNIFGKFGFRVEEKRGLTRNDMVKALEELSVLDDSDLRCCFVVILSQSSQEGIACSRGQFIAVADIWRPFTRKEAKWVKKPKVIIMQAPKTKGEERAGTGEDDDFLPIMAPNKDNILLCCSTDERKKAGNSLYMATFIETLIYGYPANTDLESIMTKVHKKISEELAENSPRPRKIGELREKLYLRKADP